MIEMIQRPRIETEELSNDNTYGRFMVEPLERGFGTTLGNSLRRVLLSSRGCSPEVDQDRRRRTRVLHHSGC